MASGGDPAGITFTWHIHNISLCKSKMHGFSSINFRVGGIEWLLQFYPNGDGSRDFASFYLKPTSCDRLPEINTFVYVLSIRTHDGHFNDSKELGIHKYSPSPNACKYFIKLYELYAPDVYVDNDILTLRCRLWKRSAEVPEYRFAHVNCIAHANVKVAKLDYLWIINDLVGTDGIPRHNFDRRSGELHFSREFCKIDICLSTGDTFADDAIYFGICSSSGIQLYTVYQIHLLDASGSIAQSLSGEVVIQKSNDIQKFPFLSKRKLFANKESYLPDGKLTLKCEFSFSGDLETKKVVYGLIEGQNSNSVEPRLVSEGHELWKQNLRTFYSEGKFSDLIVRTPNREFPVHKAILCAQSEVISRMLSHDMAEKNSGVFQIKDFDDDTVSKLLEYLYTNTLEDVDYALAKDLYFAADKYRITPLQKICSKNLMDSLDSSNVCDILLMADQLRDQVLKSAARDLIVSSPREIVNSDGWRSLRKTNIDLVAETTEWMILNKIPE